MNARIPTPMDPTVSGRGRPKNGAAAIKDSEALAALRDLDSFGSLSDLRRSPHHREGPPSHTGWTGRRWTGGLGRGEVSRVWQ